MNGRRWTAATALLGTMGLSGCIGTTEPATEVEATGATLNARGTADKGPATSSFEFWPTGAGDLARITRPRSWPADASGPFSERVERLAADTPYSFRVCGSDDRTGSERSCAQTRSFTTRVPVQDAAHGSYFHPGSTGLSIDATSGPAGERPRGSVRYTEESQGSSYVSFQGFVTCLRVDGERAAIGAVGREFRTGIPDYGTRDANVLLTVVDGTATTLDSHGPHGLGTAQPGLTPPDCSAASFASQQEVARCSYCQYPAREGDFTVDDAPAARR